MRKVYEQFRIAKHAAKDGVKVALNTGIVDIMKTVTKMQAIYRGIKERRGIVKDLRVLKWKRQREMQHLQGKLDFRDRQFKPWEGGDIFTKPGKQDNWELSNRESMTINDLIDAQKKELKEFQKIKLEKAAKKERDNYAAQEREKFGENGLDRSKDENLTTEEKLQELEVLKRASRFTDQGDTSDDEEEVFVNTSSGLSIKDKFKGLSVDTGNDEEEEEEEENEEKKPVGSSNSSHDDWREAFDTTSKSLYYYNKKTKETSWTDPRKQEKIVEEVEDTSGSGKIVFGDNLPEGHVQKEMQSPKKASPKKKKKKITKNVVEKRVYDFFGDPDVKRC